MAAGAGISPRLLHLIYFNEPFGSSFIEAKASRTRITTTRRGSIAELIDDGTTEFLVETPARVTAAIYCAGNLNRAAIRRRVVNRFSVDRVADDHGSPYRRILG
ncbi:hypothetical protein RM533_13180 [Croceicoccus sp. F390]|uniref:Uncharacterized protein n=1 Tax=Croceicoccus esteveae TaxID=3075597 RepID=A0ABU2ZKI2_9SPHN|nr:hypothetical protein [Croceicoccus sp. F390]MDT0577119.1 hypothetical protein [Croceicoccus sp. F390]